MNTPDDTQEIVVGLDLGESSTLALRWAADEARQTGGRLRAVHALPSSLGWDYAGPMVYPPLDPGDHAGESYREAVSAVWEQVGPEPGWRLEFYTGNPGTLLVDESAKAGMLVIGTREHVGFSRIVMGSVSHYCLSHARCPVVAVPAMGARRTHLDDSEGPVAAVDSGG